MKEFDCTVSSTWSVCGKVRAEAFTHRHFGQDREEELSQLHYIIGPMRRSVEIYIHNEGRLWATWDHYPIFERIHEEPHVKVFQKKGKGGRAASRQQKINLCFLKREVMKKRGQKGRIALDCTGGHCERG